MKFSRVVVWLCPKFVQGFKFSSHHFCHSELLSFGHPSFCQACSLLRCLQCGTLQHVRTILMRFSSSSLFLLPAARVETRFSVLGMQFCARQSPANRLLCYTIFVRMPEMYLACWIMLRCPLCHVFGCARYRIVCFVCAVGSRLIRACVMVVGNTHVFVLSPRGFTCGGGIATLYCILSIVQPCRVSTKHLLADKFSCMCILLSELCCVLLHQSAASHKHVQINIWR